MNDAMEERLAAYLDGALTPEEMDAFESEVERDPALAAKALQWQENDRFIVHALAGAERPIEEDLAQRLGLVSPPRAANDNAALWRRVAAAAVLAVGVGASALALRPSGGGAADPVSLALDGTASLADARLPDGRTLTPVLTVRATDGRWCREYRIGSESALACRDADRWKVEAKGAAAPAASASEIGMAAGASDAEIDAAYRRLGAADPVDKAAEADLLRRKWR